MMRIQKTCWLIFPFLLLISCQKTENPPATPELSGVQYITIGDVRMAYRTIGEGYPLLLCMGFTGVMDLWPPVVLQRLATRYKLIIFENRGMGYSKIINDTADFSVRLFAEDAANLMDALNIPKAHIMGWSMGTYIAQELTLNHPEKVDRVILYAADCGDSVTIQPDSALMAGFLDPTAPPETKLLALFPAEWLQGPDPLVFFPTDIIEPDPAICNRQNDAIDHWFAQGGGSTDRLGNFDKVTLLITGDQDICTPWRNTLIMQPLIENSDILILPGGGHGVMYQYPYLFAGHILMFLE